VATVLTLDKVEFCRARLAHFVLMPSLVLCAAQSPLSDA
jgi:hypothetical protein